MLITVNGERARSCMITRPLDGVWHAAIEMDGSAPSGRVTIDVDGLLKLSGTVVSGGDFDGRVTLRVVGGAGGLTKEVSARDYERTTLRVIAQDTLSTVGESLSPTADSGVLGTKVTRWARPAAKASSVIGEIARRAGAGWRILADGTVWLGVPAFPARSFEHDLLEHDPVVRRLLIVADDPTLDAGVTLDGRQLVSVTTTITHARARTEAYYL